MKCFRESRPWASSHSFTSQYWTTFFQIDVLICSLVKPLVRRERAEGREYMVQVAWRLVNQDLTVVVEVRTVMACLVIIFYWSWASMASRENWARWSWARAGRHPANR